MSDAPVVPVDVLLAQYNPMTLASNADRKALATLAHKSNVSVLFAQEGRAKRSGIVEYRSYLVCKSAALHGQWGCEIWILLKACFGFVGPESFTVTVEHLSIIIGEPRFLAVALKMGPFSAALVSFHASHKKEENTVQWWVHAKRHFTLFKTVFSTILSGADANVTFPTNAPSTACVGYVGAKAELPNTR